jgi:hypothetical protein
MMSSTTYWWTEISNIPKKPGVYAWYYSPEITDFDLQQIISSVNIYRDNNDLDAALKAVKDFLQSFLFRYFQEEPYQATLRGALKPRYEGCIEHKPELSSDLLQRIIEEPERLITIKQVLEQSSPDFSSPIYIGMSESLGDRIKKHKKLIEKYSSQVLIQDGIYHSPAKERDDGDQSFAMRICSRSIPPMRLFVIVNVLEDLGKRYVDIENILNRIHYPLLGRN